MILNAPGTWRARVTAAEDVQFGLSSNNNEQVAIPFVITQGEHQGELITYFGSFTEKAVDHTLKAMRNCGWQGDDLSNLVGITDNEVELVCAMEEYNGQMKLRVRWVNRPGEGKVKLDRPLDSAQRAAFAARMKGTVIAARQAAGVPGGTAAAAVKQDARNHGVVDEVPF